jgi:hypothetical protein
MAALAWIPMVMNRHAATNPVRPIPWRRQPVAAARTGRQCRELEIRSQFETDENTKTPRHRDTKKTGKSTAVNAGFLCVSVPWCLCVLTRLK